MSSMDEKMKLNISHKVHAAGPKCEKPTRSVILEADLLSLT